ncbi:MAG: hypothetical protein EOP49_32895, partial [Sphingobacteriales bacterium]
MNKLNPQRFPLLRAAARNPRRFDIAIENIAEGTAAGSIRNVRLNDAKSVLSNAVNEAWKKQVSDPFFCAGKWDSQSEDVQDLNARVSVYGLHDVISASKKIGKSKATGAAMDAMKGFIVEVLPLALAVADLKGKVVKGRAPSSAPAKPVNPNKIIKTCPVCFRPIAVKKLMVHHGYERPGYGWQTPSCPGAKFEPLEVSSAGLEWLISTLREELQRVEELLRNRFTIESVKIRNEGCVTKDSPEWSKHFEAFVARQELEVKR